MNKNGINLAYNAKQLRVRVTLKCGAVRKLKNPPSTLINAAKERLQKAKKAGELSLYIVYQDRIERLWKRIKSEEFKHVPDEQEVTLTLGAGTPSFPSIKVEPPKSESDLCELSFRLAESEQRKLSFPFVLLYVQLRLKKLGIKGAPARSQLRDFRNRAAFGFSLTAKKLQKENDYVENTDFGADGYEIKVEDETHRVSLVIYNASALSTVEKIHSLVEQCKATVEGLQKSGFKFFESTMLNELNNLRSGIELFGLGLPYSILTAQRFRVKKVVQDKPAPTVTKKLKSGKKSVADLTSIAREMQSVKPTPVGQPAGAGTPADKNPPNQPVEAPVEAPVETPKVESYMGMGLLKISVDDDKMSAEICDFKKEDILDETLILDDKWLKKEIDRLGLVRVSRDNTNNILTSLKEKTDINGLLLAEGEVAQPSTEPHLVRIMPKISTDEDVDFRKNASSNLVSSGQLLARVEYQIPGKKSVDVFGTEGEELSGDEFVVEMGESVEHRDGLYYSTCDGLLLLDGSKIDVSQAYVHEGDVNLTSGDIEFEGDLLIEGSVDTGATVRVKGNVTINGGVRNGFVICEGDLIVENGIVTGETGYVKCRGNLTAEFVENSTIYCTGDIEIKKALINSKVYCDKNISVIDGESTLGGGTIYFKEKLLCQNIGFEKGAETEIFLGADWRFQLKQTAREQRYERIKKMIKDLRREKVTMKKETSAIRKKRNSGTAEDIAKTLERLQELLGIASERLNDLGTDSDHNEMAFIEVNGVLLENVKLHMKERSFRPPTNYESVAITQKLSRGTYFGDLAEFQTGEKKAS